MVRASKGHNLDQKYKKWRKGKSEKASKLGSIKHQIRGQQRLLQKATEEQHRLTIQAKIDELKASLAAREKADKERQNARKSHGTRFIERQKLCRNEKNVRKDTELSREQKEEELYKIALDMVYVAHYPADQRYIPLFRSGERVVDTLRPLARRGTTRKRIIANLPETAKVDWIKQDMYDKIPAEWSIQLENDTFGQAKVEGGKKIVEATNDDRFTSNKKQSSILEAMEQVEAQLDEEMGEGNELGEDNDTNSSSEEADPLEKLKDKDEPSVDVVGQSDSSSEDDSDSSSDEEENNDTLKQGKIEDDAESSASSDSSDSDSSSDDENGDGDDTAQKHAKASVEEDDFLVAADVDVTTTFKKAKRDLPAFHQIKGDKSQGWATQRQRPGEFKKKRQRS